MKRKQFITSLLAVIPGIALSKNLFKKDSGPHVIQLCKNDVVEGLEFDEEVTINFLERESRISNCIFRKGVNLTGNLSPEYGNVFVRNHIYGFMAIYAFMNA